MKRIFTDEIIDFMIAHHKRYTVKQIAEKFNLNPDSVKTRCKQLRIKCREVPLPKSQWTKEQDAILLECLERGENRYKIAKKLEKTEGEVGRRYCALQHRKITNMNLDIDQILSIIKLQPNEVEICLRLYQNWGIIVPYNYVLSVKRYREQFVQNTQKEEEEIKAAPRPWLPEEEKYILDNWKIKDIADIALYLNRSKSSCRQKAFSLGIKSAGFSRWKIDEIQYLEANHKTHTLGQLSEHLKRTPGAVQKKLYELEISAKK